MHNCRRLASGALLPLAALLLAVTCLLVPAFDPIAGAASDDPGGPQRVVVGFADGIAPDLQMQIIAWYGGSVEETNSALNFAVARTEQPSRFIKRISQEQAVQYAEVDVEVRLTESVAYAPGDPDYDNQWGPVAIKADMAWDLEKGSHAVTIAIVDTGVDYDHADLGNYVVGGYDWVNGDPYPMDDDGHGTHCAGIAAATMDNGQGIAGIAQVRFFAEKALDSSGKGQSSDVASAIQHAADLGADIISLSLGNDTATTFVRNACQYAWNKGCLLVAAAGNDNARGILYPAAFPTVISVGAIDRYSQRVDTYRWGSNWGSEMELMAPGKDIWSTAMGGYYEFKSGTSMATPHVAGVAALIWSANPELTNQQVREILIGTADDLGSTGWDEYYGYGRVDARESVVEAIGEPPEPQTIYVGPAEQYTTIQEGVEAAVDGDTVIVRDGVYNENIAVARQLTIRSQNGAALTTVEAADSDAHVFEVTADGVSIEGFTCTGASSCDPSAWKAGIYLASGTEGCTVSENVCSANCVGIYLYGSTENTVCDNVLTANSQNGLRVENGSSYNTISGNTLDSNSEGGLVLYELCQGNVISGNTVANHPGAPAISLSYQSRNNILFRNILRDNATGLYFYASSSNTMYLNEFSNTSNVISLNSSNTWRSPTTLCYIYDAAVYKGFLGNWWHDYVTPDSNGDGIGDTAKRLSPPEPGDASPLAAGAASYTLQAWYLSNPVMYRGAVGQPPGSVSIGAGDQVVWTADTPAAVPMQVAGSTGDTWTGVITFATAPDIGAGFDIKIGYSSGEGDFTPGGPGATITGDGSRVFFSFQATGVTFTIPQGDYLAFRVSNESDSPWRIRLGGWSYLSSPGTDPGYGEDNQTPYQPTNLRPRPGERNVSLTPTLQVSAFSDPNTEDQHAASRWQVTTPPGDYSEPVFDSGRDSTGLTTIQLAPGTLANATTYYWRVRHQDSEGAWSLWSRQTSFTTINQPPAQPANVLPADGAEDEPLALTLECTPFSDPDSGDTHAATQWQLTTTAGAYSSPVFDSRAYDQDLTTIALAPGILQSDTTYYWRVRHQDNHGAWSDWSEETSFTTLSRAPDQPANVSPANGSSGVGLTPTLECTPFSDPDPGDWHLATQWQITTEAGQYSSCVYDTGMDTSSLTSLVLPPGTLQANTRYYWRVRYSDSHGNWSDWSEETSFATLNLPPGTPRNVWPPQDASGISVLPVLRSSAYCDPDPGDSHFASQWQITSIASDFSSPAFDSGSDEVNLTHIAISAGTLDYATTYWWRVRHMDSYGAWSDWSEETSFTTLSRAPDQPTNVSPANGSSDVGLTPTLECTPFSDPDPGDWHLASQWQISTQVGQYSICVYDTGAVSSSLTRLTVAQGMLQANTQYYWRVRYSDTYGNWSDWSEETSFATLDHPPTQPTNLRPQDGASDVELTPTLTASAFQDPDADDIHTASQWQVSTSSGDYSAPIVDTGAQGSHLTSYALPEGVLDYGTTYYWRVRYCDDHGMWSEWSTETAFATCPRDAWPQVFVDPWTKDGLYVNAAVPALRFVASSGFDTGAMPIVAGFTFTIGLPCFQIDLMLAVGRTSDLVCTMLVIGGDVNLCVAAIRDTDTGGLFLMLDPPGMET